MAALPTELLDLLQRTDEVGVVTHRGDGTSRAPVVIWVVRSGNHAYVRSVFGSEGGWYRHVATTGAGAVDVGGRLTDVRFTPVPIEDRTLHDALDAAYRSKYGRYGAGDLDPILTDRATATTLRIDPA